MPSKRTGALNNAFSYATKIDPEAIALFIAVHTKPGDTVLDPFGGSGSTGVAAKLCARPTPRMKELASEFGVRPVWGPRDAVIYELSPVGALAGRVMANPPDPQTFRRAANEMMTAVSDELSWMYQADSPEGNSGAIRHLIWSEVLVTTCCRRKVTFWDAAVRKSPLELAEVFCCPRCGTELNVADCPRAIKKAVDVDTGQVTRQRERRLAWVYGVSDGTNWSRAATRRDSLLLGKIERTPVDSAAPQDDIFWGDLHRSGYHAGISRFAHLYTPRNWRVMARLWSETLKYDGVLRDALQLLLLSYNASHSTILTRVVVKHGLSNFVVSGAQSGVLYVSGLPLEKNILIGVTRKIKTFEEAFGLIHGGPEVVRVVNGSSTDLDLARDSIDYVFTDPPFGNFIPYSEINQINEVWLGKLTDRDEEAIVSPAQGKGVNEYQQLMKTVFSEVARVLKPEGAATVVFHASTAAVWEALGQSLEDNGLGVVRSSVLDKVQVSFKQVVHDGGTRGDALFLLQHDKSTTHRRRTTAVTIAEVIAQARSEAEELTPKRLYSRYVAACIERKTAVEHSAPEFYALVRAAMATLGTNA